MYDSDEMVISQKLKLHNQFVHSQIDLRDILYPPVKEKIHLKKYLLELKSYRTLKDSKAKLQGSRANCRGRQIAGVRSTHLTKQDEAVIVKYVGSTGSSL